ncbi:hypothetical protein ACPCAA_17820 [Streptomyces griseoincarnatus]
MRTRKWRAKRPLDIGPVFTDNDHPWRSACGISVGSFGRYVYVFFY